jgi:hypothetical protein
MRDIRDRPVIALLLLLFMPVNKFARVTAIAGIATGVETEANAACRESVNLVHTTFS